MRDMTGTRVPIDYMVAAALKLAAKQLDGTGSERMLEVARQIEHELHGEECPLCQQATCYYECPLTESRRDRQRLMNVIEEKRAANGLPPLGES